MHRLCCRGLKLHLLRIRHEAGVTRTILMALWQIHQLLLDPILLNRG